MKYLLILCSIFLLISACSTEDSIPTTPSFDLVLLEEINIGVSEPSDLAYDVDSNCLWTVSDNTNRIYKLDLEGHIIEELTYVGEDLEGIFYDENTQTLWIAEEGSSQIVNVSLTGAEIQRHSLPITTGTNSGLEGICLNSSGNICLVKEKDPGKYYRLNSNFAVAYDLELDFAGDYAAITFDAERECFWIVSDQNQRVYLWTETQGVTNQFSLPFSKPEGICLIPNSSILYFVSDSENMLYKMELKENQLRLNI